MSLSKHKYLKHVQNKSEAEVWQFPQVVVNFFESFYASIVNDIDYNLW